MIKKNKIFILLAITTSVSLSWGQQAARIRKFSETFQKHQEMLIATENKENDTQKMIEERYNTLSKEFFGDYYQAFSVIADSQNPLIVGNIPQKGILDRLYLELCNENFQAREKLINICVIAAKTGDNKTYYDIRCFLDKIPTDIATIERAPKADPVFSSPMFSDEDEKDIFFEQDKDEMDAIINAAVAQSFERMQDGASTSYAAERKALADITPAPKKITSKKITEIKSFPTMGNLSRELDVIGKKRRRSFDEPYDNLHDNLRKKVLKKSIEEAKGKEKAEDN